MEPSFLMYASAAMLLLALVASLVSLMMHRIFKRHCSDEKQPFGGIEKLRPTRPTFFATKFDLPPLNYTITSVPVNRHPRPSYDTVAMSEYDDGERKANRGLIGSTKSVGGGGDDYEDEQQAGKWRIWFQIHYDIKQSFLEILIFRLKSNKQDSPPASSSSLRRQYTEDKIFFTATVLTESDTQTQVQRIPIKPTEHLQQTLKIGVSKDTFSQSILRLSMYSVDEQQCRKCCGHTVVKLGLLDFDRCETYYFCNELDSLAKTMTRSRGDMHLSLCYDTRKERLMVQVFAAKNLPDTSADRRFYMKAIVTVGRRRVKVDCGEMCNSLSGIFKGSYSFHVPYKWLQSCSVQFLICELKNSTEKRWGHVVVGSSRYAHGTGLDHWNEMINQQSKVVEMWHAIRHA